MKFPRNAKIFRGSLDVAPFAGVFFLLVLFVMLASLVYTPGVAIQLPEASLDLTGMQGPSIVLAVDAQGRLYFENQIISEESLRRRMMEEAGRSGQPLKLFLQADKTINLERCTEICRWAKAAGIKEVVLLTLPREFDSPDGVTKP
jgi:biopolymer transport protein ExbD